MVVFNCRFCGYSVEHKNKPERCPYCSKENGMVEEENAEELVGDENGR